MCTVTWWHHDSGYTLFFNRDEQRAREEALAPQQFRSAEALPTWLAPVDPEGGGTWLATNEHGLSVGLLNLYELDHPKASMPAQRSRGLLVMDLVACASIREVGQRLESSDLSVYRPFTVFSITGADGLKTWQWDGLQLVEQVAQVRCESPLTSSSFETRRVIGARLEDFDKCKDRLSDGSRDQATNTLRGYHESVGSQLCESTVLMSRSDARTVSISKVEVDARSVKFTYWPVDEGTMQTLEPVVVQIPAAGNSSR